MGRPRQYLTPEARNAANRAKSQRSYERYVNLFLNPDPAKCGSQKQITDC